MPTLAEVCARPDCASELEPSALTALIAEASGVVARLASVQARKLHEQNHAAPPPEPANLISVADACALTGLKPKFFYSRAGKRQFGFVKRLSERTIKIDPRGLRQWLAAR